MKDHIRNVFRGFPRGSVASAGLMLTAAVAFLAGCGPLKYSMPAPQRVRPNGTIEVYELAKTAGPQTTSTLLADGQTTLFLVEPPIVTTSDVESVSDTPMVIEAPTAQSAGVSQAGLEIILTPGGAAKMRAATAQADGRTLAVVINGTVVAQPRLVATIGKDFRISGEAGFQDAVSAITAPIGN